MEMLALVHPWQSPGVLVLSQVPPFHNHPGLFTTGLLSYTWTKHQLLQVCVSHHMSTLGPGRILQPACTLVSL